MKRLAGISALVLVASLVLVSTAEAQEKADEARAETVKRVLSLLEKEDSFTAVEYVQAEGEPLAVATRYFHLVMDLYWKAKNLPASVTLGRASVQYCLTQAQALAKTDPKGAKKFRGIAQMLSFNLASFTWPGWAEKAFDEAVAKLTALGDEDSKFYAKQLKDVRKAFEKK